MSKNALETRQRICRSALIVIERWGSAGFTIDLVANEARCAKGLIHYHFGTKISLLAELVGLTQVDRAEKWRNALNAPDAQNAIEITWGLIQSDVRQAEMILGGIAHWDPVLANAFRAADADFAQLLGESVGELLRRTGLAFDVPAAQAGGMLAAVVTGTIVRLAAGAGDDEVQEAYALGWLSLLSLTAPLTDA